MKVGKVVIVGGPGMVGRVLFKVLGRHNISPAEIISVGHSTVGSRQATPLGRLTVQPLRLEIFKDAQYVFFVAGAAVSKGWVPKVLALAGIGLWAEKGRVRFWDGLKPSSQTELSEGQLNSEPKATS